MNITALVTNDVRNQQVGDWQFDDAGNLIVKSIPLGDWRYEALVQLHEAWEAILCKHRDISDENVTAFDALFEKERADGLHGDADEDGDDVRAPYRKEHFSATNAERMLAAELGVVWSDYEDGILAAFPVDNNPYESQGAFGTIHQ